ncbi:MAG: phosphatase [Firmicutes bacterium]|nr:phosphatase [Bacillota bacterium]
MILRKVNLPDGISGNLFLSYMPGRNEPFSKAVEVIKKHQVSTVICLNPFEEIVSKSPEYAKAIELNILDFEWEHFPLFDFGIPDDEMEFIKLVGSITERLRGGESLLIHCAGGIGRTATLAVSVLLTLGLELDSAQRVVREAGAMAQSNAQKEFMTRMREEARRNGLNTR